MQAVQLQSGCGSPARAALWFFKRDRRFKGICMRRLTYLLLPLVLAACDADVLRVQPAIEWTHESPDFQVEAQLSRKLAVQ